MPFSAPIFLITDRPQLVLIVSSDVQDLDVWAELGSPGQPSDVTVLVEANVDVTTMTTGMFAPGTVIDLTMQANSRILGRGGSGGNGGETVPYGNDENAGRPGKPGVDGEAAITIPTAITLDIDMDNGDVYGGGGGGGGGGGTGGTDGNPNHNGGGGGGGAQGWDSNPGGLGGFDQSPQQRSGDPGGTGNEFQAGTGGNSGRLNQVPTELSPNGLGGDGGEWGLDGTDGDDCFSFNPIPGGFNNNPGGAAGVAGAAFEGVTATVNFVGADNEAALRTAPAQLRGPRNTLP